MTRPLALTAMLSLAACAQGSAEAVLDSGSSGENIYSDEGGELLEYMGRVTRAKAPRIVGLCGSACTLYLSHPNVCIGPGATLVFHQASNIDGTFNAVGTAYLIGHYPQAIQHWIVEQGGLDKQPLKMSARAARRFIRRCT